MTIESSRIERVVNDTDLYTEEAAQILGLLDAAGVHGDTDLVEMIEDAIADDDTEVLRDILADHG